MLPPDAIDSWTLPSPDGAVTVEIVRRGGERTPVYEQVRVLDARTGDVLVDLWPTDWVGRGRVAAFEPDGALRLDLDHYHGGAALSVLVYPADRTCQFQEKMSYVEPLAELPAELARRAPVRHGGQPVTAPFRSPWRDILLSLVFVGMGVWAAVTGWRDRDWRVLGMGAFAVLFFGACALVFFAGRKRDDTPER